MGSFVCTETENRRPLSFLASKTVIKYLISITYLGVPRSFFGLGSFYRIRAHRETFSSLLNLVRCKPVQTREGNSIDWDSVRMDYETKSISDRALAKNIGVSDTALRKRAKKGGWVKLMDCAPAIEPACKPERNSPPYLAPCVQLRQETRHRPPAAEPRLGRARHVSRRQSCRMHGGADGSGAPKGTKNGNYKHGRYTKEVAATRQWLREASAT